MDRQKRETCRTPNKWLRNVRKKLVVSMDHHFGIASCLPAEPAGWNTFSAQCVPVIDYSMRIRSVHLGLPHNLFLEQSG